MKYLKTIQLTTIFFLLTINSIGQVAQRSVVEHFTNTSCSICASNNGNIHSAIKTQSNVLHISFHPSSPYSNDFFNVQNKNENDDRTNFYGIYGSTPRVVLNGTPISYSTLTTALANSATNTSNFTLNIMQVKYGADSFSAHFVIKKISQDTITKAKLFVGVLEDTINQATNNGEKVHYNVFRKALSLASGNDIILPINVGDSIVTNFKFKSEAGWNMKRLHTLGILQRPSKMLINSNKSSNSIQSTASINNSYSKISNSFLYPNPLTNAIIYSKTDIDDLSIYNQVGERVEQIEKLQGNEPYQAQKLSPGIYTAVFKVNGHVVVQKLIMQ